MQVALTEASGEVKWGKAGRRKTEGKEKACGKKELAWSKLRTAHVSMTAGHEGRSFCVREVMPG